jgi:hypothetical protein
MGCSRVVTDVRGLLVEFEADSRISQNAATDLTVPTAWKVD